MVKLYKSQGVGKPSGSDTNVQFNDGGTFGGDSDFTWNKTTNILTVNGTLSAISITDGTSTLTSGSLTSVKLGSLTDNGFVKTSGGDGTLSVDTNTYLTTGDAALTYLKIDTTNDPLTGNLEISKADPEFRITDTGDSNYSRWTRSDTLSKTTFYNKAHVPGSAGSCLYFDGTGDYAVASNALLNDWTSQTIVFWIKEDSLQNGQYDRILEKGSNNEWTIIVNNSANTDLLTLQRLGSNQPNITTTSKVFDGTWHHIAIVITSTYYCYIYLDGVLNAEAQSASDPVAKTGALNISQYGGGSYNTKMRMDELAIWNRELTADDISDIYCSGAGLYIDPAGTFPTSGALIATGLEVLYHFDQIGGLSVTDSSGNGIDALISGNPTWVTGNVPIPGTDEDIPFLTHEDGAFSGEEGILTIGGNYTRNVQHGLMWHWYIGTADALLVSADSSAITFNPDGGDIDTVFESDTLTNILNIDAGADSIGFACAPATRFNFNLDAQTLRVDTDSGNGIFQINGAASQKISMTPVPTVASAADASLDCLDMEFTQVSVTGSTNITNSNGFNYANIEGPVYTSSDGAMSITYGSTLRISGPPSPEGDITITNPYALWIASGVTRHEGNIDIKETTTTTTGVILKDGAAFLHNFHHPTGDTATPTGRNLFLGVGAGNFTMGSTATSTSHASYNIGIGYLTLTANTTGYDNIAIGQGALNDNTSGYYNIAIGTDALSKATTRIGTTAVGYHALQNVVTGRYNSAFGYKALEANTSEYCCAFGLGAMSEANSNNNSAFGVNTLQYVTGASNSAFGAGALSEARSAASNAALGYAAGQTITGGAANATPSYGLYLGTSTTSGGAGSQYEIVIGVSAAGDGSNTCVIGKTTQTQVRLNGGVLINPEGGDYDSIFEGDTDTELFRLDAGTDTICISGSLTTGKFNVDGTTFLNDKLIFTQTDGNEYIDSLADGYMDYGATTAHRFSPVVQIGPTAADVNDQFSISKAASTSYGGMGVMAADAGLSFGCRTSAKEFRIFTTGNGNITFYPAGTNFVTFEYGGALRLGPTAADANDQFSISKTGKDSKGGIGVMSGDEGISIGCRYNAKEVRLFTTGTGPITFWVNSAEQVRVEDGKFYPYTDNDVDLGDSSKEFKDLRIDGLAYIDGFGEDTDMGDFDIHSIDGLYGVDDQVYIDMGTDGYVDYGADTGHRFLGANVNIQKDDPKLYFTNTTSGNDASIFYDSVDNEFSLNCDVAKSRDNALNFDSTPEYVNFGNDSGLEASSVSISAWVYIHANVAGSYGHTVFAKKNVAGTNYQLWIRGDGTDGTTGIVLASWNGTGNVYGANSAISLNTWTHIAMVSDGSNVKFFVNGSQSGTTKTQAIGATGTGDALAGVDRSGAVNFDGVMDELCVWTGRALKDTDIADLYAAGSGLYVKTVDNFVTSGDSIATNIAGLWHFDEASGTVATDDSGNGNNGTLNNMEDVDWVTGKVTSGGASSLKFLYVKDASGGIISAIITLGDDDSETYLKGVNYLSNKLVFTQTDGNEYIDSLADGYMDYGATTEHRFNNTVGITQATVGNEVLKLESTATNDDPYYGVRQYRAATTDATPTTLATIAIAESTAYLLEARVVAHRTGGAGGSADDSAIYILQKGYKNSGGTVTAIGGSEVATTSEDNANLACAFAIDGTDIDLNVTGDTDNAYTWHATVIIQKVST